MTLKKDSKLLLISGLSVCLSLLFLFMFFVKPQITFASAEKFEIQAINYIEGQWSNENVVVKAVAKQGYETGQIFYSINDPSEFLPYENQVLVETEGENFVRFIFEYELENGFLTQEYASIEIKIDKTKPLLGNVEISETQFTQNPVSIRFHLGENSNYQNLYYATIFEEIYLPMEEYLLQGQIVFEFIAERNTILNVGDIIFFDQAKNALVYDKKIVIDNIDNTTPDFHIQLLNGNNSSQKYIEIKLGYIHSEAKQIVLIHPSGKEEVLQVKLQQKVSIKENGVYIVKVTSNSNLVFSRGLNVNNIKQVSIILPLFIVLVVGLSGLGIAGILLVFNKNKKIKNK